MSIKERILLGLGAGCAAVLLLQAHAPHADGPDLLASFGAAALLLPMWWGLGGIVPRESTAAERLLLGLVAASLGARFLGAAGLLGARSYATVFFVVLPILAIRRPTTRFPGDLAPRSGWEIAGWTAAFLVVLPPPVAMDAMAYHLALPMRALARGSFENPFPQSYDEYLLLKEPADVFALALDPSGRAAALGNLVAWPILGAALARVARAAGAEEDGVRWGTALAAVAPLGLALTAHTKPDLFGWAAGAFAFAAVLEGRDRDAGLWAGASLLAKSTNVFLCAPIAAAAVAARLAVRDVRGAGATAILAAWPLLFFLDGHPFGRAPSDFTPPYPLVSLLALFSLHIPATISAPIGPLALPFLLAAFLGPLPRRGRPILAAGFILWLASGSWARYAAPLALVGAAAGVGALPIRARASRILAGALLTVSLATGIRIVSLRMDVLGWLSGRIDAAHYRAPWQSTAPILEGAGQRLPAGRRVILFGEHRVFPLGRDARVDDYSLPAATIEAAARDSDAFFIDCGSIRDADAARGISPPVDPAARRRLRDLLRGRRKLFLDEDGNAVYDLSAPADSVPPVFVPIPRVAVREDVERTP